MNWAGEGAESLIANTFCKETFDKQFLLNQLSWPRVQRSEQFPWGHLQAHSKQSEASFSSASGSLMGKPWASSQVSLGWKRGLDFTDLVLICEYVCNLKVCI